MKPHWTAPAGLHPKTTRLPVEGQLPSFDGATGWLNSPPLTATDLHGKLVLVNFWTYTCVNWLRQLPYLRAWAGKYADHRLVVIGVHTPEFGFEHDLGNVRRAVRDLRIDYPVAIDNDYAVWGAFDNHYWPALYFADARGRVRHHHFGEGEYQQSEMVIQQLLAEAGTTDHGHELVSVDPRGLEVPADWASLRSPENSDFFSLFSGLVFNARDGHPCHVGTTRNYQFKGNPIKRPKQRRLYSYGHLRKLKGACPLSFDYYLFEAACLQFLSELRAADLLPQSVNRNESTIIENEAELAGVEGRLNALKRQLEDPETSLPTVLEVVGKLEKKRVELRNQIDRLKREAATHEENPISQAQTILELLKAADDAKKRELRTKLRVVIPSIVESIYVVPLKQPKRQVFFTVQINLKNGGIKQIFCTNKQFCGTRREALQTVSLDLRKPADVQRLLKKPVPAVA